MAKNEKLFKLHKYEEDWEKEISNNLSDYTIYKHEIANVILNIILAVICVFVLKLKVWMLPIAFIVCDALLTPLNILFVRIIPNINKNLNTVKGLEKRNRKLAKMITKQRDRINGDKIAFFDPRVYKDSVRRMESEMLYNEEQITRLNEELVSVSNVYAKIANDNKSKIEKVISEIASFKLNELMIHHELTLDGVVIAQRKVAEVLEKKQEAIDISTTAFFYGEQLLEVLENCKKSNTEKQLEYIPEVKKLIHEYELHLNRLKERIERDEHLQMKVDIKVLMSELTKDKKGE